MSHPNNIVEIMEKRAALEAEIEGQIDKEVTALNLAGKLGMNRKTFKGKNHGKSALPLGDSGSERYGTMRLQSVTNAERRQLRIA